MIVSDQELDSDVLGENTDSYVESDGAMSEDACNGSIVSEGFWVLPLVFSFSYNDAVDAFDENFGDNSPPKFIELELELEFEFVG